MNDRMKESLSALVDGEADELEVRRVLNEMEQDDELRQSWQRYQMMGSIMRDEPVAQVDLSRGIMQAIDGEPMDEIVTPEPQQAANEPQSKRWFAQVAVAASVTLAVLIGVRFNLDTAEDLPLAQQAAPSAENVETLSLGSDTQQVAATPVDAEQLAAAQRQLQQYVLEHAEGAALNTGRGMMPFARVASFDAEAAQQQAEKQAEQTQPADITEAENPKQ